MTTDADPPLSAKDDNKESKCGILRCAQNDKTENDGGAMTKLK
jgi:hypothetical protein